MTGTNITAGRNPDNNTLVPFFLITFLFTWFFWLFGILHSTEILKLPFPVLVVVGVGAHGPLAAALLLTYRSGGRKGVFTLLRSGFALRMKVVWWIVIIAVPSVFAGLSVWIRTSVSNFTPDTTLIDQPLIILPNFLFLFFLGGSFQEEFGWRGFALPVMLKKWSPLTASLILGAVWGVWHLPLFFISGLSQSYMSFGIFFLLTVAFSIVFTGVYVKTGKNLFSALLLHTAINTSLSIFPPIEQRVGGDRTAMLYMLIFYIAAAILIVLRKPSFWLGRRKSG